MGESKLQISPKFALPLEAATRRMAILAMSDHNNPDHIFATSWRQDPDTERRGCNWSYARQFEGGHASDNWFSKGAVLVRHLCMSVGSITAPGTDLSISGKQAAILELAQGHVTLAVMEVWASEVCDLAPGAYRELKRCIGQMRCHLEEAGRAII